MADITYETQDAVPEDLRESAESRDGKFVVSVSPTAKVTEFRDNNTRLSRERDDAQNLIGRIRTDFDFDPEKYDEFRDRYTDLTSVRQQVEDGKLVKDTSLDEAVQQRTAQMQRDHQAQVSTLTTANGNFETENKQLKQQISNMQIDSRVGAAALEERSGVRPDAVQAVQREAREVFQMRDGKLTPLDADGNVIYASDGSSPMSPAEWIKTHLSVTAPYLFRESSGGGSGGSGGLNPADLAGLSPAERMRAARSAGQ